jgi:hypothetical protein
VPGPDSLVVGAAALVAYSPGPGLELIPYFLGLLTWAGFAFVAIFLSPITAFVRRLCRIWRAPADAPKNAATELIPKTPAEGPPE